MIRVAEPARDAGAYPLTISFYDDTDSPVTPVSIEWDLRNQTGDVINNRQGVSESPGTSVTILLSGDDVKYEDGATRFLMVTWTYDSAALGNGVEDRDEVRFAIERLVGA